MIGETFPGVLAAAQRGEEWAVGVLWRDLHPRLSRYLRGLAPDVAEDVESEAWIVAARDLGSFVGGEDAFRAWLFTVARHRLLDWRRRAGRRPATTVPVEELAELAGGDDPARTAEEALSLDAALGVVRQLTPEQAEVILLRVVAGLSVERVAAMVGKRPGAVRALQHRALRRLAQLLGASRAQTAGRVTR
jgi:RNA polymerase sigma-70 factor (ECF subfamily)